ncbi:hypothetical protein BBJ29_006401 [Phytophthora kernoviae]|uniref:DUF3752 domain-containing protein n=1 Tax=Phytophthora kernoviae TaxID=325452 RepID=A0A3F2RX85_9STRA|nr:hypothetical protein BBJ29_006401 [Phytophthora kernoviae]RLN66033.1 hypothetical protein BBP00_00002475 [Phytophthora kernoviae]
MGKHGREVSRSDEKRKRHKKHQDEKKKHKKHKDKKDKKSHRRDKRSRSDSYSTSDSDAPSPDFEGAMVVVRELLMETPEIAKDLLALVQMVDDGEVAVIGGIENRRIRAKLKELFPLLGLVKLREPKSAFAKPRKGKYEKGDTLMQVFQHMLSGGSEKQEPSETVVTEVPSSSKDDADEEAKRAPPLPYKRDLPIGPALPPASMRGSSYEVGNNSGDDDDDDEVVGPALPGMKGFRLADERVEAEMARKARQLEKEQWESVRDGGKHKKPRENGTAPVEREAWMTMMPESSILKDSLGPATRPSSGKPAAFRSKEPAAVDKTWFASPEERDRAKRANLDMELLGYVREENAPIATSSESVASVPAGPTVNESILPGANPEADDDMRKKMEALRKARGPSLLEQHQRKQAEQAKDESGRTQTSGGWNRDRDLTVRRGMSGDDADRMITAAKQINSKFTAPTISRQFL